MRKSFAEFSNTQYISSTRLCGNIKWYSPKLQYGFVIDYHEVEYYFNSSDVLAVANAGAGVSVEFSPRVNQKGPRATLITDTVNNVANIPATSERSESRVKCSSCGKLMVPRLVLGPPLAAGRRWTPVAKKSVCPFCGSTHLEFAPSQEEIWKQRWQMGFVIMILLIFVAFSIG